MCEKVQKVHHLQLEINYVILSVSQIVQIRFIGTGLNQKAHCTVTQSFLSQAFLCQCCIRIFGESDVVNKL